MTPPTRSSLRSRGGPIVAAGAALVVAVALGVAIAGSAGGDQAPRYTGELSAMGVPVVETPGTASGTTRSGTLEVVGARWELGDVPLDVAVRPTWVIRNTGDAPVTLGEPSSEVRSGCCPGPLALDEHVVAPGAEATLTFELAMHPGMEGWHDLAVHVPVDGAHGADVLTVDVTGEFG